MSTDGGKTFQPSFDLIYTKKKYRPRPRDERQRVYAFSRAKRGAIVLSVAL